jgi:hypothetical protein
VHKVRTILLISICLSVYPLVAQPAATVKPSSDNAAPAAPKESLDYVCPMDADVRSDKPGFCTRCGMKLVLGIREETEYPFDLTMSPRAFHAGEKVQLKFHISDPKTSRTVNKYEIVHEKFFHMFIVSDDLKYFLHDHPVRQPDGTFLFDMVFPKPGMYRIVGDFYPTGGTPQLIARTVIVPGLKGLETALVDHADLKPELGISHCKDMDVELTLDPPQPVAGFKTMMFFHIKPADGFERYIGAWAHMLAASDDLIDLIHDHPYIADGGPQLQFNIIFPRAHTYRLWVQFQRKGVVNTAEFTIPVSELK